MTELREATVHIQTTPTDYVLAQRVICRGPYSPWRTLLWLAPALILLGSSLFGMLEFARSVGVPQGLRLLVTVPLAWILYIAAWRFTNRFRMKSLLDPNGSFLTATDFRLAADGVHWSNKRGEGRTNWSAIGKIEETAQHVYIFVDRAAAHVVPKRNFANPVEAQNFVELARTYLSTAHAAGVL